MPDIATKVVQVVVEASTNKTSFAEAQATARGYLTGLPSGLLGSSGPGVAGISGGGVTSAELLNQRQQTQARALEQLLASRGIIASPGIGKLSQKELSMLGLTEAELSGLGIGRATGGVTRAGEAMGWGTRSALEKFPGFGGLGSIMGFGSGTLALGAAGLGLAGVFELGKSLTRTYQEQQHAIRDLKSAYDDVNVPFDNYNRQINDFIVKNARFIDNQAEVREGYATLTRAGIDQVNVQKAIDDALDISGNTGKTFTESLNLVLGGLEGNTRGLKMLGIQVKDYGDLTGSTAVREKERASAEKAVQNATEAYTNAQRAEAEEQQRLHDKLVVTANDLMTLQDRKEKAADAAQKLTDAHANLTKVTQDGNEVVQHRSDLLATIATTNKDGRDSTDAVKQSSNELHASWNKLAKDSGPALVSIHQAWDQELALDLYDLDQVVKRLGDFGTKIDEFKKRKPIDPFAGLYERGTSRSFLPPDPYGGPGSEGFTAPSRDIPGIRSRTDGELVRQGNETNRLLTDIKNVLSRGTAESPSSRSAGHRTG